MNDIDRRGPATSPVSRSFVSNNLNRPQYEDGTKRRLQTWVIKKVRDSMGLDQVTVLKMLKGGLPPTIVIAMYQSSAISDITSTTGYVSAIMAVASQCLLPRAKFIKVMFYNLLSTCICAALCCLGVLSAVKAREHTTPSGASLDGYNGSASAVSAVWLIFAIWTSNTFRAFNPQELQDPMVAFTIFASVTLTHTPQFSTISSGLTFIKQLLITFLVGFAVAIVVSLLILPITNRRNFFIGVRKYRTAVKDVIEAQKTYIEAYDAQHQRKKSGEGTDIGDEKSTAAILKTSMISLIGLHDRLHGDLIYAQNEVAWGKLTPMDLEEVFSRLRSLLLPLAGVSMLPDIFKSLNDEWIADPESNDGPKAVNDLGRFLQPQMEELNAASDLVNAGTQHALLILDDACAKDSNWCFISSYVRGETDVEQPRDDYVPGGIGFALYLEKEIKKFTRQQQHRHTSSEHSPGGLSSISDEARFSSENLFVFLFTQNMLRSLLQATLELVRLAESKRADGFMKNSRVIIPQRLFIGAWLRLRSGRKDVSSLANGGAGNASREYKGAFDPEHLPPANGWERFGNGLRHISRILASDQSTFGFRAAAASFSVAILAFLHQTEDFFNRQRLIWVLIVIAFGMSPTSGASLFSFAGRILATVVSLVLSLIVWYIVNGHVAGVIVFLYVANVFEFYFYVKYPRFIGPSVIAIVTMNVIIAYELQVDQLGITVEAGSTGQPYYPVYLFGPYKLLAVIVGCAIAFIWTIFPYPITSRSQVRKLLGRSLFILANFYSCMHTTIEVWIDGSHSGIQSPPQLLAERRKKLFSDEMTLITAMRSLGQLTLYEPAVGGKFPKPTYDNIISEIQSVLISMALMAQIPDSLGETVTKQRKQEWLQRLADAIESTDFSSHIVTSLLCHLSAAASTGMALPPQLSPPEPFPLARQLRTLNDGLLDTKNAQDPAFAVFASLEVLSSLVNMNLAKLVSNVKSLVGEVKFDGYVKRSNRNHNDTQISGEKLE